MTLPKTGLRLAFLPEKILACGHFEIGISGIKSVACCDQALLKGSLSF